VHGEYGPTFRAMLLWFAFTAMRPGEVFALEHGDVDGDLIHVRRNVGATGIVTTPKNHKTRTIILPGPAKQALAEAPRSLHSSLVFETKQGTRFSEPKLTWYFKPCKAAWLTKLDARRRALLDPPGTPFTPYHMRHFCATYLRSRGLSWDDIAVQLGHSDHGLLAATTYGHPSEDEARERIRRAVNPAPVTELRRVDEAR
jgi:integrase